MKVPGVLNLPLLHLVDDHPVLSGHHHLPHASLPDLEDILCKYQLLVFSYKRVIITIHSSSSLYHLNRAGATEARKDRWLPQRHILQWTILINKHFILKR